MALALETGTYTFTASYYDPNGNGTNTAWTGDYTGIDDAVRSPTNAATGGDGNSISTGTSGALEDTNFGTGTYDASATYILYIFSESGAKRGLSVSVDGGSNYDTIHGANAAQAWRTLDVTADITNQTALDNFSVRWRCDATAGGGGAGTVTVHAAYLAAYDPTPTISLGSNFTGITPKAVLLWSNGATSATVVETASHALSFGFATYDGGAAQNRCVNTYYTHNSTPAYGRVLSDNYCVAARVSASDTGFAWGGSLSSFASAAFTLDFSTGGVPPNNTRIHWMALGGDELTAARAGNWTTTASNTFDDVTVASGWGQPAYVLVAGNTWDAGINNSIASQDSPILIGAASTSSDARASMMYANQANTSTSLANDNQLIIATGGVASPQETSGALASTASWPTDGFRVSYSDPPGFNYVTIYLALKGTFLTNTGVNQMPSSSGNQTLTGNASGTAKGAFIWGAPTLAATGVKTADEGSSVQIAAFNIGATDGTNEATIGTSYSTADPSTVHRTSRNDKAFVVRVPNSTTEYLADGSLSSANVVLNWNSVDATDQRYYHYVVFSSAAAATYVPRYAFTNFQEPGVF